MLRLRLAIAAAFAAAAASAGAQIVATSPRPDHVAVTVYRAPERRAEQPLNRGWLTGFAMVTETRTVTIPAGEGEIRFEGVAGGIVPQSAIIRGLPEGVIERNYDAQLLSAASLIDRSLGRRVMLRRTSYRTGEVREQDAIIRSGAEGALVVETAEGFEALRCTGLNEKIVYPAVPAGLSARPTLSVRARSGRQITATITLSYLATGFDWEANYVVNLSADGRRADIFAWLTIASTDETSFVDADTQAVAGRLNREALPPADRRWGGIILRCWPRFRTSDILEQEDEDGFGRGRRDLTSASPLAVVQDEEFSLSAAPSAVEQVVAQQEELGDLKLYRIPVPVTVASNSQKQVALLSRTGVEIELVYRHRLFVGRAGEAVRADRMLITRNRTEQGLGLPLPAGRIAIFAERRGRPLLLGQSFVEDRAVGEPVEIQLGTDGMGVMGEISQVRAGAGWKDFVVTAVNRREVPVRYELEMFTRDGERLETSVRLPRRNGRPLWSVEVPANGRAELRYRVIAPTRP